MKDLPTVTIVVPVLNEEAHLPRCLTALSGQTYPAIDEVLVIDGGSTDRTVQIAAGHAGVRVLQNPRRIQAAALNIGLAAARGDIIVRMDGHALPEASYVAACVAALSETGAALVGGAMRPIGGSLVQRGIAAAMTSRLGVGPAKFHRVGVSGWTDTAYLGAFWTATARDVGGFSEVPTNEDAEFAIRMCERGGVWLDDRIRSSYTPRGSYRALGRQFFRYGVGRARTVRRHPSSIRPRQLAAPMLVLGLVTGRRAPIAAFYAAVVAGRAAVEARRSPAVAAALAISLPVMHLTWGTGFLLGLVTSDDRRG